MQRRDSPESFSSLHPSGLPARRLQKSGVRSLSKPRARQRPGMVERILAEQALRAAIVKGD